MWMLSRHHPQSEKCATLYLASFPGPLPLSPHTNFCVICTLRKKCVLREGHLGTKLHFIKPVPSSLSITFTQYMVKDSYLIGRFRTNFFSCGGLALDGGVPPPPPHPNQPLHTNTIVADCRMPICTGEPLNIGRVGTNHFAL